MLCQKTTTQLIIIEQNDNPNNIYMKMSTVLFILRSFTDTYKNKTFLQSIHCHFPHEENTSYLV